MTGQQRQSFLNKQPNFREKERDVLKNDLNTLEILLVRGGGSAAT